MSDLIKPVFQKQLTLDTIESQFCSDWLKGQIKELFNKLNKKNSLLEEAVDWLCPHIEATIEFKRRQTVQTNVGRVWCSECSNYIRLDSDTNLIERIQEELGG